MDTVLAVHVISTELAFHLLDRNLTPYCLVPFAVILGRQMMSNLYLNVEKPFLFPSVSLWFLKRADATVFFGAAHQISVEYRIRIKEKGRVCQTEDALDFITK